MKIKLFCFFYNEAALLPFFYSHYRWVDEIHAIVSRSQDGTREWLQALAPSVCQGISPKITIEDWEFTAGFNDFEKVAKLNEVVTRRSDADWHMVVDADELVWPKEYRNDPRRFFIGLNQVETVVLARMWNVYRHVHDKDLDPTREPVRIQRVHGIADLYHPENLPYHKPVVTKPNLGLRYTLGNHALEANPSLRISEQEFRGAHWQNADPSFAVTRRVRDRKDRLSEVNLRQGLGCQHHFITEADVRAQCAAHENDPMCF